MLTNNIVLTSKSDIKLKAIKAFLGNAFTYHCFVTTNAAIPEQPINSGQKCAELRIDYVKKEFNLPPGLIISIENDIVDDGDPDWVWDTANVVIKLGDLIFTGTSTRTTFGSPNNYWARIPRESFEKCWNKCLEENHDLGISLTLGKEYFKDELGLTHNNWHTDPRFGGFDRSDQILDALIIAFSKFIGHFVKEFPNYPKPNIIFKYQGEIWSNPILNQLLNSLIVAKILHLKLKPTKIVGIDSRGYISGSVIADRLCIGFVPITKKGKTPGNPIQCSSFTEYSNIDLELNPNLITSDDKVLIVDDLIGTGGTFVGAKALIEKAGGKILNFLAILQVDDSFDQAVKLLGQTPVVIVK